MRAPILSVAKAGFRWTGMVLVVAMIGAGPASADTYRQGGSSAAIEQGGGRGSSEAWISRYKDGQTIIQQDGSSTDITVQRGVGSPSPAESRQYQASADDRFDRRPVEARFLGIDPDEWRADTVYEYAWPSAGDEFKRRILNRMRSDVPP